jgi:hypothetical protein
MALELGYLAPAFPAQPPGVAEAVCMSGELVGVTWKGVKVGRGVLVDVGVGDTYQRDVGEGVRVGG